MKKLLAALLLIASPALAAPYYQHPTLTPSSVQGELFVVPMWTNAGVVQETLAPAFYHNATPTDPWYHPSTAFAFGWSAGGGNAFGGLGPVIDIGPQIIYAVEDGVGLFSTNGKANVVKFFNCSASATACGSLSAGVIANGTFESGGQFTRTWKQFGAHPVGYFLGPSVLFGGPKP
jgi:hypothetical protein